MAANLTVLLKSHAGLGHLNADHFGLLAARSTVGSARVKAECPPNTLLRTTPHQKRFSCGIYRERERQTDRQTQRDREREGGREREREREREIVMSTHTMSHTHLPMHEQVNTAHAHSHIHKPLNSFRVYVRVSSQVKIFFNDGSLNKHFTCFFFFFLHQAIITINSERERERGRGEGSCKSEQRK